MKKIVLLTLILVLVTVFGFSQTDKFWSGNNENRSSIITDKAVTRLSFPKEFKLFNLSTASLKQELFSVVDKSSKHSTVISLPNADGKLEQFEVFEASNFEPALQAQFPNIRAYSGKGITDKSATLKLSISPVGIQTMVFRTDKENEFIEPYSKDHTVYAAFKSQRLKEQLPWSCSTPDADLATGLNTQVNNIGSRAGGDLKTMRLAQSCTGEYANFFGASTAGTAADQSIVLSAFNNTITRCNGVYEKDLALHLNLVANTASVIFYDPATDPYGSVTSATAPPSSWNSSLQTTLTNTIGEANYDIGHLFGASGGGGNAGCIGCVCTNGQKGSGITSPATGSVNPSTSFPPSGDNFDIDYVAHEVGHQLGGNHTFSHSLEGTGVNKEVGSGITIMGYAGITAYDVAPHSIEIFHQASIAQIQANLATKTCPVTTVISNATPVVAAVGNFTIPVSTPFALTGSATDADAGDVLTYCWEQNDNSTTSTTGSAASAAKTTGPNYISFLPTVSPTRVFPKLSTILTGALISGPLPGGDAGFNSEVLSSVSRILNFRLTVRDNAPYSSAAPVSVGQTQFTDMAVTVSNTSGPFAVTAPNTAVIWNAGSNATVTWSVNNTTAAPVSCASVNILLSTDGGLTFPTVLAAVTANDGTEVITVPGTTGTTCRVKVEAVGNIFFDISNTNFTIGGAVACGDAAGLASSAIGNNTATISWNAVANAVSYAVDYKLNSSAAWTSFATAQTATTADLTGLTQGSLYDWRVQATCAAGTGNFIAAQFTTTAPFVCNAPSGLAASAITSSGVTVSWAAVSGAASYAVDYKLNSSTVWTSAATAATATSVAIAGLTASSLYDYRVSTNCGANGASGFSAAQFTTAAVSTCPGPLDVSTNGTTAGAATIPFNNDVKGTISSTTDLDYYKFVITTGGTATITLSTLPADYDMRLYSSNGTTQLAISQNSGTTSETITRTYTAGTYYVKVYGFSGANSTTGCYTLKVQLGTASRGGGEQQYVSNGFTVSPNPAAYTANLSFKSAVNGTADIIITDGVGNIVMQNKVTVNEGANNKTLDVSKLSNGMYFVKIHSGDKIQVSKIVIAK
jgi:hypothetical protein